MLTQTVRRHSATPTGLSPKSATSKPSGLPTPAAFASDPSRRYSHEWYGHRITVPLPVAPVVAQRRRPVAAHVEEAAQLALAVANQQHRQPADDDRRPLLAPPATRR